MIRPILATLLMLYGTVLHGGSLYRLEQDDGVPLFSNTGLDESHAVEVGQMPMVKGETFAASDSGEQNKREVKREEKRETKVVIPTIELSSPGDQQTVWHDAAGIEVRVTVTPALPANARVIISVDNRDVANGKSETINIGVIYRGSHTIAGRIEDNSGKTIAVTPTSTFHVRQHSRIKPPFLREEESSGQ